MNIVCLCGSVRFKDAFLEQAKEWTNRGWIVLMPHEFDHAKYHDQDQPRNLRHKEMLDRLHKRKISLSDLVYIVNPTGYFGESTRSEIAFAERFGIPVEYMMEVA